MLVMRGIVHLCSVSLFFSGSPFLLQKIKIAALRMYTCCVERINYDDFFESKFICLPSIQYCNVGMLTSWL